MAFDFDRDTYTNNDTDTSFAMQTSNGSATVGEHDFDAQCQRVLRCTAIAMLPALQRGFCQANHSNACD